MYHKNNFNNMFRDLEYENNNIGYDSQYTEEDGGGIKCKNYIICENVLPKWWFECKESYLCTDCHMNFGTWGKDHKGKGTLEIYDNIECPICLDEKLGISQPNCNHTLCINCFKRCYYGDEYKDTEPIFPYPEIEDEYYEDTSNPKWDNYPLIKLYNKNCDIWEEYVEKKYEEEEHLRKCPVCRK